MSADALFRLSGLIEGRILQRYKRFLADVELADGTVVTAHCANTGTMASCWEPGDTVLLRPSEDPKRKLGHTWIACRRGEAWVGIDTGIPNKVVAEAARRDLLPGLRGLHDVRTEVRYGLENSRVDVFASDAGGRQVFIEVKNATLRIGNLCAFPDAVTVRGTKHLRELQGVLREGHLAVLAFFVHRSDVEAFDAAREIDPAYASELDRAACAGLRVLPLAVDLACREEPGLGWIAEWELSGLLPWRHRSPQ